MWRNPVDKGSQRNYENSTFESTVYCFLQGTWKRGKGGCQQAKVLLGQGQAPGSCLSAAQNTHSAEKSQMLQQGLPLGQGNALWPGLN